VALMFMAYSLYMYRKRSNQIMRRESSRYDDQRGPVLLTALLLLVMMVSFVLTLSTL
jgi:hypothetical protein